MKKLHLSLLALVCALNFSYAQNTNPWPSSGNVGIGTNTPNATLDVVGNVGINNGGLFGRNDLSISQYTNITESYYFGLARINNMGRFAGMRVYNVGNVAGYPTSRIGFSSDNTMFNYTTEWMTINEFGYVGINNTLPVALLNVNVPMAKTSTSSPIASFLSTNDATSSHPFGLATLITGASTSGGRYVTLQTSEWALSNSGNLALQTAGGNVLIGQTSQTNPAYRLDVWGSARANKMVVNATGADFVFQPTYKLRTLPEIEKYVKQNHHLPEIKSARDMQANGLDLGDNQIKLLQKVEELTLYLIEKDKQLKEQDERLKKLEAQLSVLTQEKKN